MRTRQCPGCARARVRACVRVCYLYLFCFSLSLFLSSLYARPCLYVTQLPGSVKNLISQSVSLYANRTLFSLTTENRKLNFCDIVVQENMLLFFYLLDYVGNNENALFYQVRLKRLCLTAPSIYMCKCIDNSRPMKVARFL